MKRNLVRVVGVFLAVLLGLHAPSYASTDKASSFVNKQAKEALDTISNDKLNKGQKEKKLEKIFEQSVDLDWVGRFVMGRHWRTTEAKDQKRYLSAYKKFVLHHYAARFTEYTSGRFEITGTQDDGDNEYRVSMEIASDKKNDPPIMIDYRIRSEKGGFKIFDIIIEGVSMITTQRSEFGSILNEKGVDTLIKQLEERSISIPE